MRNVKLSEGAYQVVQLVLKDDDVQRRFYQEHEDAYLEAYEAFTKKQKGDKSGKQD